MEGLEGGGGGGGGQSAEDVFSMFFGGGGGGGGRRGVPKGEDIVHQIKVSLEDLYNGKTVRLAISRKKPCQDCEGRGGKIGAERTCSDCNGRGARIQLRQIGPGMVQQVQSVCGGCRGAGKCMNEKDKCRVCMGSKVLKDRKVRPWCSICESTCPITPRIQHKRNPISHNPYPNPFPNPNPSPQPTQHNPNPFPGARGTRRARHEPRAEGALRRRGRRGTRH
jgi:hypothetical protein